MAESFRNLWETPLPTRPSWISGGALGKSSIVLFGGPSKTGKSFLCLDLIHNLGVGGRLWGLDEFKVIEPVSVLYLEGEVGETELQRRLHLRYQENPPPDFLHYLCRPKGLFVDTRQGEEKLAEEIKKTASKVLVLDPIARLMRGDENDTVEVGRLFNHLDNLIIDHPELSIILIHHCRKSPIDTTNYDPLDLYTIRGSAKFRDFPDGLAIFQRLPPGAKGELWRIRVRFELRQAEPVEEKTLIVRENGIIEALRTRTLPVATQRGWER